MGDALRRTIRARPYSSAFFSGTLLIFLFGSTTVSNSNLHFGSTRSGFFSATSPFTPLKMLAQEQFDSNHIIFETEYWRVEIKENQSFLGSCTIKVKRAVGSLAALTPEEWIELRLVIQHLEYATKHAFGATMVNWLNLMNDAYQITPNMPLVHLHLRPRYSESREFNGYIFHDKHFGHGIPAKPTYNGSTIVDEETLKLIVKAMQDNLPNRT